MRNPLNKNASPSERLNFILDFIYNFQDPNSEAKRHGPGDLIDLSTCYMYIAPSYFGLEKSKEMLFYLNVLEEQGFIKLDNNSTGSISNFGAALLYPKHGYFTYKGLSHLASIERRGTLSNKCFVAMAFDEKKENRLNAIKKACLEYSIDAFIVDEYKTKDNQTIDSRIIAAIKTSRFCIVDFTGLNQGAYFEAGFAMGRDMKVILVCEAIDFKENKKHFDVNHYPFAPYDNFDDLTNKLKIEIGSYIKD